MPDKDADMQGLRNIIGTQHFGGVNLPAEDLSPEEYAEWYWAKVAWVSRRDIEAAYGPLERP